MGEWMYRPMFSWPRHCLKTSGQLHAPATLPPWKEPLLPIGQEAQWAPELVWMKWKSESSWPYWDSNSDPSVFQKQSTQGSYWAGKDSNQNAECPLTKNCMKSVLGLNILLKNPTGTLHRRPRFQTVIKPLKLGLYKITKARWHIMHRHDSW
jgi:hypothetical protein